MTSDWRSRRFVALDFETTGLDPRVDGVVSYGAIPIEGGRVDLGSALAGMVDPGIRPGAESIRIHRLLPSDVAGSASPAQGGASLRSMLADDPIVVWTAWVEAAFIVGLCGGRSKRWRRRMIDVRHLVVRLDERSGTHPSPARSADLAETALRLGVPAERDHDALADAFVTAQLFVVAATRLAAIEPVGPAGLRAYGARSEPGRRR